MKVDAIKCPVCEVVIWSRNRSDCQYCDCQKCFIEGGRSYTKYASELGITPIFGALDVRTNHFEPAGKGDIFQ